VKFLSKITKDIINNSLHSNYFISQSYKNIHEDKSILPEQGGPFAIYKFKNKKRPEIKEYSINASPFVEDLFNNENKINHFVIEKDTIRFLSQAEINEAKGDYSDLTRPSSFLV